MDPEPGARLTAAPSVRRLASWVLATQAVFVAAIVAGGIAQPRYDHLDQTISELASREASAPAFIMAGFVAYGVGVALLAVVLSRSVGRRLAGAGAGVLLVAAAAMSVVTFARMDCGTSSAACRARVDAGIESDQQILHNLASLVVFLLMALAPWVWSRRFRRHDGWRDLARASRAATGVALVLLVVFLAVDGSDHWSGLAQRAFVAVPSAWIGVVAVRARRLAQPVDGSWPHHDVRARRDLDDGLLPTG